MNILHIKCFWEIMKTKSFTEAAERLYLTQSTVSKNISSLEKELGFLLFERRGRTVVLTPEGKQMLNDFGAILAAYSHAESTIENLRKSPRVANGTVHILMVPSVEKLGLISKINQLASILPAFHPTIEVVDENQVLLGLQTGYCDMAFCSDCALDNQLYDMEFYSTNRFNLILSKRHPYAGREILRLEDLEEENLILMHPESMLWDLCVEACENVGFYPMVALTTCRPDIAIEYVRSTNCIYMAIEFEMKNCLPEDCRELQLANSPTFNYAFAWRKGNHQTELIKKCIEYLKDKGQ